MCMRQQACLIKPKKESKNYDEENHKMILHDDLRSCRQMYVPNDLQAGLL